MKVAFIGLGTMGYPMAGHLARHYRLRVHNRSPEKASRWVAEFGGTTAASPAEAADGADAVLLCLPKDEDTISVAIGENGAFAAMKPGSVFVDHGSGAVATARMLAAKAREKGLHYLDAPVTGARVGAEAGRLAVMVGGEAEVLARVEPLFRAFAQDVQLMGGTGAGHITKMANVIIGHGTCVAIAEAIGFVLNQGLDAARVVDVLMKGSSRSFQLEHRSGAMIGRDYQTNYPVAFARKDLGNVLAEAKSTPSVLLLSAMADQLYAALEQKGLSASDTASLIEFFAPRPQDRP